MKIWNKIKWVIIILWFDFFLISGIGIIVYYDDISLIDKTGSAIACFLLAFFPFIIKLLFHFLYN